MEMKKERGRAGGEGDGAVPRQTESPQTKTHGARAMPTLPRWLPAEVVLYGTSPVPPTVLSSAMGDAQKPSSDAIRALTRRGDFKQVQR